jgi:hypothetical protein
MRYSKSQVACASLASALLLLALPARTYAQDPVDIKLSSDHSYRLNANDNWLVTLLRGTAIRSTVLLMAGSLDADFNVTINPASWGSNPRVTLPQGTVVRSMPNLGARQFRIKAGEQITLPAGARVDLPTGASVTLASTHMVKLVQSPLITVPLPAAPAITYAQWVRPSILDALNNHRSLAANCVLYDDSMPADWIDDGDLSMRYANRGCWYPWNGPVIVSEPVSVGLAPQAPIVYAEPSPGPVVVEQKPQQPVASDYSLADTSLTITYQAKFDAATGRTTLSDGVPSSETLNVIWQNSSGVRPTNAILLRFEFSYQGGQFKYTTQTPILRNDPDRGAYVYHLKPLAKRLMDDLKDRLPLNFSPNASIKLDGPVKVTVIPLLPPGGPYLRRIDVDSVSGEPKSVGAPGKDGKAGAPTPTANQLTIELRAAPVSAIID